MKSSRTETRQSQTISPGEAALNVLVVDDDPTNRLVLCGMLQSRGYRTETATGGAQALAMMESNLYQTVFIDIRMPGIDGFETIRRMRRLNAPHRPAAALVVAVSASVEKAAQAKAEGFDAFLAKPVKSVELSLVLNRLGRR